MNERQEREYVLERERDEARADLRRAARELEAVVATSEGLLAHSMRTCAWVYDAAHDKYDTDCSNAWHFEAGGVVENGVRFCPYCGGRVTVTVQELKTNASAPAKPSRRAF